MATHPRNKDSIQDSDIRLLIFRLETLTETTKNGFLDIKSIHQDHEKRLRRIEEWRSGIDADHKARDYRSRDQKALPSRASAADSQDNTDKLIKVIFAILGLLGTALGLIGTGIVGS